MYIKNLIGIKNPETISLKTIVVDFLLQTIKCKHFYKQNKKAFEKCKQYNSLGRFIHLLFVYFVRI